MQVGMTKDQGLYNKPSVAVHPGALAAGTLPHNITCPIFDFSVFYFHILILFYFNILIQYIFYTMFCAIISFM